MATKVAHDIVPDIVYTPLMRSAKIPSKAICADRIGNHVRTIMRIGTMRNTRASARSVGLDAALRNGADRDLVRTHGNWVSNLTVESHYQRSRMPTASMTSLVLGAALESDSPLANGQGD
ncbi:hypothetical protein GGH91_003940 [Coemansia sp. RSA 2671]|nr:hypothetical protein GGH91_003940 [Coemansia sp. RSA 2671]